MKQGEDMRLPGDIIPVSYNVRLVPFIGGNFTTDGFVEILVKCLQGTYNVSLNSADIDIDISSVSVVDAQNGGALRIFDVVEVMDLEIVTIRLDSAPVVAGSQYLISMKFTAYLNDELRGFYRSSYVENGVTKYLAVTQFESTDARRSFPCFDEPKMKAVFNVTLGRPDSLTAASNMPLKETIPMPGVAGYVWDIYEPSVVMSSYLVAFMVSEFIYVTSDPSLSDVEFRIWARPAFRNQTEYARDVGPRILTKYEDFFNILFPLPKQDMAAIPDFAAGAMENWGLITYREADLLIDPKKTSASNKQRVAVVIAHELAHQWFGDLVTMEWWNEIWLNEGFASYMEYIGTDAVEPGFFMDEQFIIENLQYVFATDALETSRPINIDVNTPDEISSLFDAISYEKGSSVLRMLANFMGNESFKKALSNYLNAHAYGNAVQDDLWAAMSDQAAADNVVLPTTVKTIMDTWTLQMGFPVITITRNYLNQGATLTQERFLLRKSNDSSDTNVYQWWVPLTYTRDFSLSTTDVWMSDTQQSMTITNLGAAANQWVIFNVGQVGYYRVQYDATNYELINNQLLTDLTKIGVNNRAQLMDDSLNLARVGRISYAQALDLTRYLANEREYVPFDAALTALNYINGMFRTTAGYGEWKRYMSTLIDPLYTYVGFNENASDPHLVTFARGDALTWACRLGNTDCIQNSKTYYAAWMNDPNNDDIVPANQLSTISCYAIQSGGEAEWTFAYEKYQASEFAREKSALLSAMGCTQQPYLLSTMLEMMIDSNSGIRLQDANAVFSYVSGNALGNYLAFDFLRNRWDDMYSYFYGYYSMSGFMRTVSSRFNTPLQLAELVQLRDDHFNIVGASKTVQQAIEVVQANINWMDLHYNEVLDWVKNH